MRSRTVRLAAPVALIALICPGPSLAQAERASCTQPSATVRLDHVTVAVSDLDRAVEIFREGGFRLKPGRFHPNGIENAHAKFGDGTELELLTVNDPTDELARWYGDFIAAGGGGAFLALSAGPVAGVAEVLRSRRLTPRLETTGTFRYASFPTDHELHHVYFIEYGGATDDPPEIYEHPNGASALREAWIEVATGSPLGETLLALGGSSCGVLRHPAGFEGEAIGLANGRVVLVNRGEEPAHYRVLAVTLLGRGGVPDRSIQAAAGGGVWIRIASEREGPTGR